MQCSVCGKDLLNKNKKKNNSIGIMINVNCTKKKDISYMKKQLGKYKLGKDYYVCWECWFKSLGVKE